MIEGYIVDLDISHTVDIQILKLSAYQMYIHYTNICYYMMTYVLDMKKQGVRAQTHFLSALKMSARRNILHCMKRA